MKLMGIKCAGVIFLKEAAEQSASNNFNITIQRFSQHYFGLVHVKISMNMLIIQFREVGQMGDHFIKLNIGIRPFFYI